MNASRLSVSLSVLAGSIVISAAVADNGAWRPSFSLPEEIYAAPGIPVNVYYQNCFDTDSPQRWTFQTYAFEGGSRWSKSWKDHWSWTPCQGDAGKTYKVIFNAWSDDSEYPVAATTLVKVASLPKCMTNRVTMAHFGASLTGCGYQDHSMNQIRKLGYKNFTPVGTRRLKDDGALHDAYGGWSYNSYLREYMMGKDEYNNVQDQAEREQLKAAGVPVAKLEAWQTDLRRSPILTAKGGKVVVDGQKWLDRINGGKAPDFLFIELGGNACWWYKGTRAQLEKVVNHDLYEREDNEATPFYRTLRKILPDTVFIFCDQTFGCDQDGFTWNYGSDWNYNQNRKTVTVLNRGLRKWVKSLNDPKAVTCSFSYAIDPDTGYNHAEIAKGPYSEEKKSVCSNAVHPSVVGGKQLGDAMAAAVAYYMGVFAPAEK